MGAPRYEANYGPGTLRRQAGVSTYPFRPWVVFPGNSAAAFPPLSELSLGSLRLCRQHLRERCVGSPKRSVNDICRAAWFASLKLDFHPVFKTAHTAEPCVVGASVIECCYAASCTRLSSTMIKIV